MPADQTGSPYKTKTKGYGIRWTNETGQRQRQAGFSSPSKARAWFRDVELPRMRGGLVNEPLTLREFSDRYLARYEADRSPVTVRSLKWRLVRPLKEFGDVNIADLRTGEIAAWEATLPPRFRHDVVRALRQVLDAAVRWEYLARNPAKATGKNAKPAIVERAALEPADVDKLAGEFARASPRRSSWARGAFSAPRSSSHSNGATSTATCWTFGGRSTARAGRRRAARRGALSEPSLCRSGLVRRSPSFHRGRHSPALPRTVRRAVRRLQLATARVQVGS